MDWYFFIKAIHIISATILFGTGLGIAFFMWWANKTGDLAAKVYAAKTTVLADFLFTTPSVIIQPISGVILIKLVGYDFSDFWLVLTYIGYIIAGICWLPVVWIQIKLRNIALKAQAINEELPTEYYKLFKLWFYLGWPAFISLVIIFFLMVIKPM
ncbi:DUF2269 domain-containing protein [Candidatus Trichorickettsia mobilis]|uniref:DUF2269 domain-containing protein n=1 Tax=Candidatus Trichorickettsia mobilis TaxID=1346319 RepID=A0ABZ0UUG5_9RICK|nr:DUF2269 domain-containing protein [Candidatus Trichorickettsia mobilis]WPY00732.1 DUF2269 domain-containing protein [Candidatus Trichorickettsia mobilis]